MNIEIENNYRNYTIDGYREIIQNVILKALDYECCPYEAQVYVLLTDNREICEINRQYRQIDQPTDVLSFPLFAYEKPANFEEPDACMDAFDPATGELMLGDIIISMDKVREQAKAYGHSPKRELAFLVAHSMLHLLGYDHMEESERKQMERKQREILDLCQYTRDAWGDECESL